MNGTFDNWTDEICLIDVTEPLCRSSVYMCNDCTCEQSLDLYQTCEQMTLASRYLNFLAEKYLTVAFLCLGLISDILLLLTLGQKRFREATTFVYLRVIAAVGLLLILAELARKTMTDRMEKLSRNYHAQVFFYVLSNLSDGVKLLLSTFTTFLCFDRLCSIAAPFSYNHINNGRFVLLAFCVSALIGCLPVAVLAQIELVYAPKTRTYVMVVRSPDNERRIDQAVFGVRILEAVLMVAISALIVRCVKRRGRRLRNVLTDEASKREEKRTLNLCRYQILETVGSTLELSLLCLNEFAMLLQESRRKSPTTTKTFDAYSDGYSLNMMAYATSFIQFFAFQFFQCFILVLFLMFNASFRSVFMQTIGFPFRTLRTVFAVRHRTVSPNSIAEPR